MVGGLTGGVPEPPVDRARLDEVEDVPGRPEQHARAARDEARRAPSCGDQCEHSREDDRQRERGAELRRQGEAERDASDGELRPRVAGEEHHRGQKERRDDEIVQDRGTVEEDDGERREHEAPVCGRGAREAEAAAEEDNREQARPERDELRERGEPLGTRNEHRQVEADLGDGRVPVESRVVSVGDVPDATLLVPQERAGLVVASARPSRSAW